MLHFYLCHTIINFTDDSYNSATARKNQPTQTWRDGVSSTKANQTKLIIMQQPSLNKPRQNQLCPPEVKLPPFLILITQFVFYFTKKVSALNVGVVWLVLEGNSWNNFSTVEKAKTIHAIAVPSHSNN